MSGFRIFILACVVFVSGEALAKKKPSKKAAAKAKAAQAPAKKEAPPKTADKPARKLDKAPAPPEPEVSRDLVKRESKIEFDERVVQGQRAQGAVYLFQRAETQFGSLVQTPDTFRQRTVGQVFGE